MSRLARLREERARLASEAADLNAKYPKGKTMPTDAAARLDELLSAIEAIDADVQAEGDVANSVGPTWRVDGREVTVLRNAADIRRHYAARTANERSREPMTLADFVRGVAGLPTSEGVRAALTEGTDTAGGYLVPARIMPAVLEAMVPASSLLTAGAGIIPTEEGAKSYTQVAIDTIPTAAWRSENGAVAESDPAFRAVVAAPKSLAFYVKLSRELLADAANVQDALVIAFAQAFAMELDRAGLRGSGTAPEPRGILNTTNVQAVTNTTNGASLATTKYANLFSAVQKIMEANGPAPTAAIMSPRSQAVLGALVDSTGQPLMVPDMLKPLRLLTTTQIPNNLTTGTSSDTTEIFVGDFSRMAFLMRERMSIMKLDQAFATTGQIGFVCHVRADVMVNYPKAFAVVTGVRP